MNYYREVSKCINFILPALQPQTNRQTAEAAGGAGVEGAAGAIALRTLLLLSVCWGMPRRKTQDCGVWKGVECVAIATLMAAIKRGGRLCTE